MTFVVLFLLTLCILAALLHRAIRHRDLKPDTPLPPPPGAIILPFVLCAELLSLGSCASTRRYEAAGAYATDDYSNCVESEPTLGPNAAREERKAAWARFDACVAKMHEKWGISETTADSGAKEGGK